MFVELSLLMCLDAAVRTTCVERQFEHSPISQMTECYGVTGQTIVIKHLEANPVREPWVFGGVRCTFGNKPRPKSGNA